ncbi:hypothetical protein GCM10023175_49430 [Pseudonocardia xishanensis]|uniref:Uncharacterized protein n=1 Tax=Pseudonocardia xishanensis TaxID=630995 RepID=A0ABP8RXE8_9PSEU
MEPARNVFIAGVECGRAHSPERPTPAGEAAGAGFAGVTGQAHPLGARPSGAVTGRVTAGPSDRQKRFRCRGSQQTLGSVTES